MKFYWGDRNEWINTKQATKVRKIFPKHRWINVIFYYPTSTWTWQQVPSPSSQINYHTMIFFAHCKAWLTYHGVGAPTGQFCLRWVPVKLYSIQNSMATWTKCLEKDKTHTDLQVVGRCVCLFYSENCHVNQSINNQGARMSHMHTSTHTCTCMNTNKKFCKIDNLNFWHVRNPSDWHINQS